MNCSKAREWLGDLLDGELSAADAARVEAHLSACLECGAERESLRSAETAMRDVAWEPAPDGMLADFHRRLAGERSAQPQFRWPAWLRWGTAGALATAAAAAVVIWINPLAPPTATSVAGGAGTKMAAAPSAEAMNDAAGAAPRASESMAAEKQLEMEAGSDLETTSVPLPGRRAAVSADRDAEAGAAGKALALTPPSPPAEKRDNSLAGGFGLTPAPPGPSADISPAGGVGGAVAPEPKRKDRRRGGRVTVAAAAGLEVGTTLAVAATKPADETEEDFSPVAISALRRPVTLVLEGTPLRSALRQLTVTADVAIHLQPSDAEGMVTLQSRNGPLWLALEEVARQNRLTISIQEHGFLLSRPTGPSGQAVSLWSPQLKLRRAAEFR